MSQVKKHYERAQRSLAGGISASTRLYRALGHPLYFSRAAGCRVWDLDGREYYDLCCSHRAVLRGHGDERVTCAVQQAIAVGGACSYDGPERKQAITSQEAVSQCHGAMDCKRLLGRVRPGCLLDRAGQAWHNRYSRLAPLV